MIPQPIFFFFNDTATTEIYTLSLHDALPICFTARSSAQYRRGRDPEELTRSIVPAGRDRKSTRLNSSHSQISYAVFCLKKKKSTWIAHYAIYCLWQYRYSTPAYRCTQS